MKNKLLLTLILCNFLSFQILAMDNNESESGSDDDIEAPSWWDDEFKRLCKVRPPIEPNKEHLNQPVNTTRNVIIKGKTTVEVACYDPNLPFAAIENLLKKLSIEKFFNKPGNYLVLLGNSEKEKMSDPQRLKKSFVCMANIPIKSSYKTAF